MTLLMSNMCFFACLSNENNYLNHQAIIKLALKRKIYIELNTPYFKELRDKQGKDVSGV
jgi:hypothetical protein